jgi:hypothetical protein
MIGATVRYQALKAAEGTKAELADSGSIKILNIGTEVATAGTEAVAETEGGVAY